MLVGMYGSRLGVRECVHLASGYFGNVQLLGSYPTPRNTDSVGLINLQLYSLSKWEIFKLKIKNESDFFRVSLAKSEEKKNSKNCQVLIFGFQYVAENIEG
jgi:hypothetical protein